MHKIEKLSSHCAQGNTERVVGRIQSITDGERNMGRKRRERYRVIPRYVNTIIFGLAENDILW